MRVTDVVSAIIVGLVIGVLGRLVLPGKQRIGGFATFVIGVGAAFLGFWLAHLFKADGHSSFHLWKLHWDWGVLAFQVGLAVIGIGLANLLTYTRLADVAPTRRSRGRTRRRRTRTS